MKEAFVFTLFLPNPGTTLSQLNKRHSVANAEAQLKLEMKLEAADWLKTITQIQEEITFLQKLLTLNIIQTVYSNYVEREKLIKKKSHIFLEAEAEGWPLILIICNKSKLFFKICGLWSMKEKEVLFALKHRKCLPYQQLKKRERKTGSTHDFKQNSPKEVKQLKASPPSPPKKK